jgi:hypothetical protein
MIQTVYTYNLQKRHKIKLATKLEILSRWVYPAIFVLIVSIIILGGALAHP